MKKSLMLALLAITAAAMSNVEASRRSSESDISVQSVRSGGSSGSFRSWVGSVYENWKKQSIQEVEAETPLSPLSTLSRNSSESRLYSPRTKAWWERNEKQRNAEEQYTLLRSAMRIAYMQATGERDNINDFSYAVPLIGSHSYELELANDAVAGGKKVIIESSPVITLRSFLIENAPNVETERYSVEEIARGARVIQQLLQPLRERLPEKGGEFADALVEELADYLEQYVDYRRKHPEQFAPLR